MDRNKGDLYRIGEVARLFRLSPGTLRHYEKLGMVRPEHVDRETGYRYYSASQFERLNTIRYLRALDMPLDQIAGFLRGRDVDRIAGLLLTQREAVIRKQRELEIIRRKIDNRLTGLEDARRSELDEIIFRESPPQRIAWIRNRVSPASWLDLETSLRELEKGQETALIFLGKVGVGVSLEDLRQRTLGQYDMVFLLLDEEDAYNGPVEELPACLCASVRFCGEHADAPVYYEKLLDRIRDRGMIPSGFSREITLIDYGFTSNTREFVTEIRIPVRPAGDGDENASALSERDEKRGRKP